MNDVSFDPEIIQSMAKVVASSNLRAAAENEGQALLITKTKQAEAEGRAIQIAAEAEKQAAQFLLTMDLLNSFGYEQYEISNYSKVGMRSKHNSSYWQGKPYLGFGPSAHSFDGKDKRRWNIANNMTYINELKKHKIPFEEEVLTTVQRFNEYVMISLRRIEGIDEDFVLKNFGSERLTSLVSSCETFINNKRLELKGNNITLTREGKLFADGIASELFLN
jgi:oxygen-independent coproporphyrinogen-3 oxidase